MRIFTYLFLFLFTTTVSAQVFSEKSGSVGINHIHVDKHVVGGGAAWFDFNNDGFPDVYLTGGDLRDQLYINNQNGTFTEIGLQAGLGITDSVKTVGVVTGDIDNDGDRDIFVTTDEHYHNLFFLNNGNGTFTENSVAAGITDTAWGTSAVFGDYNLDGYLDIYVDNYVDYNDGLPLPYYTTVLGGQKNFFYKNNGNGTFTEIAHSLGIDENGAGLVVMFTDFDLDNDLDLYVGNDNGIWPIKNVMYRNEYPLDSFTNVSDTTGLDFGLSNMGMALGDYNEDQLLDFYLTDFLDNVLAKNNGNGTFTDVASIPLQMFSRISWGTLFIDYNNDTYPDLFVATGKITGVHANQYELDQVFRNHKGNFTFASLNAGVFNFTRARGATTCDFDLDGDQDLLVLANEHDTLSNKNIKFYENTSLKDSNWVNISTQGTINNRDGYGTRILLHANGRTFVQELDGGTSYLSQNPTVAHFGLGGISKIDSVVLHWPKGGVQTIKNLNVKNNYNFLEEALYSNDTVNICENDSIDIGNEYRKTEGLYYDSLFTASGTDSIVMTYLLVDSTSMGTDSLSICQGDSLLFGNQYISLPGMYLDTLVNSASCDSLFFLTLFNDPSYNFITDTTTMFGDSVFVNGKFYSNAGVYIDSFFTSIGCDSLYTVIVSVDSSNISVSENQRLAKLISVFPNPATQRINIALSPELNTQSIVLSNALGQEILRKENPLSHITELNVSQLKPGTYMLKVNTQYGVFYQVVVIAK